MPELNQSNQANETNESHDLAKEELLSDDAVRVAPTLQLSRRGLVASLCLMAIVGLSVYAIFPDSVGGPPLPVKVSLDRKPIETTGGNAAMLTDVVVIENLADFEITRLGIEINGQYLLHQRSPLPVGEQLVLPQRVFTDKRSSQRYNPVRHPATEVIVVGQLPSGSRGVSKFEFE